ncbi:hypothetical protein MMC25_000877 [Agyrium rufum]|nr:hypothetical protein [Agyrium rufum]
MGGEKRKYQNSRDQYPGKRSKEQQSQQPYQNSRSAQLGPPSVKSEDGASTAKPIAISQIAELKSLLTRIRDDRSTYADFIDEEAIQVALKLGQVLSSEQLRISANPSTPNPLSHSRPLTAQTPTQVHVPNSFTPEPSYQQAYYTSTTSSSPSKPNPSSLPALPAILSPDLEATAFTHAGTIYATGPRRTALHYDRLEFVGDAYIELIATRLLYTRYPKLPAGRLSQLRELLVKNETLSEYSLAYNFDERARLPKSYAAGDTTRKLWVKTLGDVFEAYVAALILSDPEHGFVRAEAWLTGLWEGKLALRGAEQEDEADTEAKNELSRKVMGRGISLEYRNLREPVKFSNEGKVWYEVEVVITGWGWTQQKLGSGTGWSKNEAGLRAATDAVMNPLTAKISAVKREYDDRVKEEREMLASTSSASGEIQTTSSSSGRKNAI